MKKLPLILLPGLLCDADVWSYQSKHLASIADITIPNLNHASTPEEMVASVLNDAPPYFTLAGHSMGGWVALEVIKNAPERILGLALLNTTAAPDNKQKYIARKKMITLAKEENWKPIIDKCMKLFIYNTSIAKELRRMIKRNLPALINQESAMLQRKDCITILETIICPTLIVHSDKDAIFNYDDSQLLVKKIKHSIFAVIKNCGHMSPMESPQEITKLMQLWLNACSDFMTV